MKTIIAMALLLTGCARNVEYVKLHAKDRWAELGYEVVAYEGYQWAPLAGGSVWHLLKRADTPGMIYSGYLQKWGDELHVYGPQPVNQLKHVDGSK